MDGTATAELFENAARYEPELTERQREVLRLIAAGKTNGEIAEALDMTLAGAKWHVSELLTKLALDSREAAAEYHRWSEAPRRRLSRRMRGLLSAGLVKAGVATAGGVAAIGISAAVLFAMQGEDIDPGPAVPGLPFYMETVQTRDQNTFAYELTNRYWYQNESHQRIERGHPEVTRGQDQVEFGAAPTAAPAVIRDGSSEWYPGPLYRGNSLEDRLASRQSIPGTGLGPLKYASIEAWLAAMATSGGESELPSVFELEATTSFLGRPVEVYVRRYLTKHPAEPLSDDRRVWIDRKRLFVVKTEHSYKGPDGEVLVEVETATKLVYGETQPATNFVFVPEPGWVLNQCQSPTSNHPLKPPSPFLAVPQLAVPGTDSSPRTFGGSVAADGGCEAWRHEFGSIRDQALPAVLYIRQEAHNLDSVFSSAPSEPVDIGGIEARLGDANDGGRSIAWVIEGVVGIEIRSPSMSDEELLAFAKAMVAANP